MALTNCHDCGKEISTAAVACPNCGAPNQARQAQPPLAYDGSKGGAAWGIGCGLVVAAVVLLAIIGGANQTPSSPSAPSSNEITMTSSLESAYRTLITSAGFACPHAVTARQRGIDPLGTPVAVRCGPANQPNMVYENLQYLVYPQRGVVKACEGGLFSICGNTP